MNREDFVLKVEGIKGSIIARMSAVDLQVSQIIAWHINKNESDVLMFLCNKVSIRFKLEVLEKIIKKIPDSERFTYAKLIDDISKLQKRRNLFAHSMPIFTRAKDYKNINHIDLMNSDKLGESKEKYFLSEYEKDMARFNRVLKTLYNLISLLE